MRRGAKTMSIRYTQSLLIVALFSGTLPAIAQTQPARLHQQTVAPDNARFEILQSTVAARHTFRLDRFTGRVWQIVLTKSDDNAWEEMPVVAFPEVTAPTRARFQLFTSGIAVRHTFLLDTATGKSWVIVTSKEKRTDGTEFSNELWQPFAE